MKIGIAFDLKADLPVSPTLPDDWQEEFDSPNTVAAIGAALRERGHQVVELGNGRELVEALLADRPDLVFNIAEGQGVGRSRESRVPAVCELLGIPYTGSDPGTLAVALDKGWACSLALSAGAWVPWGRMYHGPDDPEDPLRDAETVRWPVIAKPVWEGSSKGIRRQCLIDRPGPDKAETPRAVLESLWRDYRQPIRVEEYIEGDELTVGVIGNREPCVLGIMRVLPVKPVKRFVYSLEVKRDFRNQVRYECPARLDLEVRTLVEQQALEFYRALGCRDVARIDFRLRDGVPYFLEANPLPGLNPESSDLVILAEAVGVRHEQLIGRILDAALERLR